MQIKRIMKKQTQSDILIIMCLFILVNQGIKKAIYYGFLILIQSIATENKRISMVAQNKIKLNGSMKKLKSTKSREVHSCMFHCLNLPICITKLKQVEIKQLLMAAVILKKIKNKIHLIIHFMHFLSLKRQKQYFQAMIIQMTIGVNIKVLNYSMAENQAAHSLVIQMSKAEE